MAKRWTVRLKGKPDEVERETVVADEMKATERFVDFVMTGTGDVVFRVRTENLVSVRLEDESPAGG